MLFDLEFGYLLEFGWGSVVQDFKGLFDNNSFQARTIVQKLESNGDIHTICNLT